MQSIKVQPYKGSNNGERRTIALRKSRVSVEIEYATSGFDIGYSAYKKGYGSMSERPYNIAGTNRRFATLARAIEALRDIRHEG